MITLTEAMAAEREAHRVSRGADDAYDESDRVCATRRRESIGARRALVSARLDLAEVRAALGGEECPT